MRPAFTLAMHPYPIASIILNLGSIRVGIVWTSACPSGFLAAKLARMRTSIVRAGMLAGPGGADGATHYTVAPADADTNTAGHQITLPAGDSSVAVTLTAAGNTSADGDRSITIAGTRRR